MNEWKLEALDRFKARRGPVILAILDGVAIGNKDEGDAVHLAYKPNLDKLLEGPLHCELKAHGKAVGLPSDDDMGNSEVGHNALGSGQIYDQGAKLVQQAIESKRIFEGDDWEYVTSGCLENKTPLHFIGLLSDGNVHSHINHLLAMVEAAHQKNIEKVFIHILLDGRDVSETSALIYVDLLEQKLASINKNDHRLYKIASGGGRMHITMDRYEADWEMVERGWNTHVLGEGRSFSNATEAITWFRKENVGIIDQFLPAFVIADGNGAIGKIQDNHSVVFFNFRGDRAMEITKAFTEENFCKFDRSYFPKVRYAGMMQYDGDQKIPEKFLVTPPSISKTFGEYLAKNEIPQLAVSETQKYGHVTYFWNGNRLGKFSEKTEFYKEITSDKSGFEERPWMKAAEITDAVISCLEEHEKIKFVRLNYPNGDMVGHTGDKHAAIISVSSVDLCLKKLMNYTKKKEGILIVVADHGNADEMFEKDKNGKFIWNEEAKRYKSKTSHTLNPVPFAIYDPQYKGEYKINKDLSPKGLSNVASTAINLMGYQAPKVWNPSLIVFE